MGKLFPLLLLSVAALLWGGTPVAMRLLSLDITPTTAICARMIPAGIAALLLSLVFPAKPLSSRQWLRLCIAAACGNFTYQVFSGFGIALIPASWTGVLFCLEPLFIALGAIVFLSERMSMSAMFGLAVATIGTLALAFSGGETSGQSSFWGVFYIVISSVGWAAYTLIVRPLAESHGGLQISLLAIVLSALPTLMFVSPPLLQEVQGFETSEWLAVAYVSIFSTVVAVSCWTIALPHVKSAQAAMFLYMQPIIASVGGMLLLNETLSLWFLCGGALILVGVFINQWDHLWTKPNVAASLE